MAERERFVPQRVERLSSTLCELPWSDSDDEARFRGFTRLVSALYHFEFHSRERMIVDAWDRIAEDPVARTLVTGELTGLLDAANYTAVTMSELDDALTHESLIPLRFEVDLDDYEEMLIYRRGSRSEQVEIPRWYGVRSEQRTITVDERVVVHTRVKPQQWFDDQGIDAADRNLRPGHVSLKQFQNVPRADLEMLLPSTQVRMRPIDTTMVAVPALVSGIAVFATKLLPTLGLIFLLAGAALGFREESPDLDQTALVILLGGTVALGGFFFRQWSKVKNRRVEYLRTLSDNLYFRTLGAGPGVLHTLLSTAEEQEVAEAIVAYRFLLRAPEGRTPDELDAEIEAWFRSSYDQDIDFEIDDALWKLHRLGVVVGDGTLQARPLDEALAMLDRRWDDLFEYRSPRSDDDVDATPDDTPPSPTRTPAPLIRLRRVVDRFRGRLGDRRLRRETGETTEDHPAGAAGPE